MQTVTVDQAAGSRALAASQISAAVEHELQAAQFIDIHTHLYMPSLGPVGLWGIDNLVTYHYLEAELFRSSTIQPAAYAQLSEATRGVIAVLQAFGLPTESEDLREARAFFAAQKLPAHIRNVFKLAGMSEAVMTNDPLDPAEAPEWLKGAEPDPLFHPVLRLDRILNKWADHWQILAGQGYQGDAQAPGKS